MLHLRRRLLSGESLTLPSLGYPLARLHAVHLPSALHHLLYSTATASAPSFAVEDYLIATCGLKPTEARRAYKYLSHVKSSDNPDAVRGFLAGIGLSKSDLAAAITSFPRILCSKVDRTLAPRIVKLQGVGLTRPEISRLITVCPNILTNPAKIPRLAFFRSFFRSFDHFLTALQRNGYLLSANLELVVKPNLAFLQQCGLSTSDIAISCSRIVTWDLERVKQLVARAEEELGVPRNSGMFRYALTTVCYVSASKISAKLDFLKTALGCSHAELAIAVCKLPDILRSSEKKLGRAVDFLKREYGMETRYIVHRPALLNYSMDKRVLPRHFVIKALKAKGLLQDIDFYFVVCLSEKKFVEKFLDNYKGSVPGLRDAYAAACKGQAIPNVQL